MVDEQAAEIRTGDPHGERPVRDRPGCGRRFPAYASDVAARLVVGRDEAGP